MALNPLIPMSGHLASPIDTQGIQENAQQIDLNKARIQEEQIKAQQAQQDQNDQQTMQQEFVNPTHRDPDTGKYDWDSYRNAVAGKVSMRSLRQLDADHLTQVKAVQDQATADRINGTLKIQQHAEQNKLIGQELSGLAALPDEAKPAYYQAALRRLQAAGIDVSGYPDTIPGDGSFNNHISALMSAAGYNTTLLNNAAKKAKAARDQAEGDRREQQAKDDATQQLKEQAAQEYQLVHQSADPQAAHDAFIKRWTGKIPGIENLAGEYDPNNQDALDRYAQKSQQRSVNELALQRNDNQSAYNDARIANNKYAIAAKATDPTLSDEERARYKKQLEMVAPAGRGNTLSAAQQAIQERFDKAQGRLRANQQTKDAKEFSDAQEAEATQWGLVKRYEAAAQKAQDAGKTDMPDPVNDAKMISIDDAKAVAETARNKAATLNTRAKELLKKNGWGEFAPKPGAAQPSADNAGAGQSWTIKGKQYKSGDPISIGGKPYVFQGLDKDGKILAAPKEAPDPASAKQPLSGGIADLRKPLL